MIKIANNLVKLTLTKQANDGKVNEFFAPATNALPLMGALSGATGGGLLGVGLGTLVEYLDNKKEKDYLKAILTGGGIGAGLGGLVGGASGLIGRSAIRGVTGNAESAIVGAVAEAERRHAEQVAEMQKAFRRF